jgi:ATP-dependent DNA ligase
MLSRLEGELPLGPGWLYEPKWDGFRAIVFRQGGEARIQSRNGQWLDRYFPELASSLVDALPEGVFDGEIVIEAEAGLDFAALLQRIHPARSRVERLSRETPTSFAAFDVLALGHRDLRSEPLSARRRQLERILPKRSGRVFATPQTDRVEVAQRWYQELEASGIEGVVAKRAEAPYAGGQRTMIKVKHARTADCVVGGYRPYSGGGGGVGSLLLGAWDANRELSYLGHTSGLSAALRREALQRLAPLETERNPFRADRSPGGPSRWSRGRELAWIAVEPGLVCEVGYDALMNGQFRHAARFLRWREDKSPGECLEKDLPTQRRPS